jgi:hypothetical protein
MRDDIDEAMHQTLKGTWNEYIVKRKKDLRVNRTTADKINSAVYYSGQYLPTFVMMVPPSVYHNQF